MQEFIELTKVIINNDQVFITSNCTTYVNARRIKGFNVKHLLKRFTALTKALKEHGCSVSHKYKTRKFVADNIDTFNNEYLTYNRHFESMVTIAKEITSKPLPMGTSDNEELKELFYHRNTVDKMLNRSSIISKVLDFENKITELEKVIVSGECNYSKVCF